MRSARKIVGQRAGEWHVGGVVAGPIRYDLKGVPTYLIDKKLPGYPRVQKSTRCHRLDDAEREYTAFLKDPLGWTPGAAAAGGKPLVLDAPLVARFLAWSRAKGNTEQWVAANGSSWHGGPSGGAAPTCASAATTR